MEDNKNTQNEIRQSGKEAPGKDESVLGYLGEMTEEEKLLEARRRLEQLIVSESERQEYYASLGGKRSASDKDGDHIVDASELQAELSAIQADGITTREEAKTLFLNLLDHNGNGQLERAELSTKINMQEAVAIRNAIRSMPEKDSKIIRDTLCDMILEVDTNAPSGPRPSPVASKGKTEGMDGPG